MVQRGKTAVTKPSPRRVNAAKELSTYTGVRSVRAYRRLADALLFEAAAGRIKWSEARAGIAAIEASASLYMGEKMLQRSGIKDVEDVHPEGNDGGLAIPDGKIRPAITRTVRRIQGVDKYGNVINSVEVVEEDTAPAPDVEQVAELPPPDEIDE